MKKKINLLIIASILGLIALSGIQAYLINNTYKLKKDAFINKTRRSISSIDDFSPALDSLSDLWRDTFLNTLADYKIGVAKRSDILNSLELVLDSINDTYVEEYQKELVKNNIPYGIKFHKKVMAIIILDSVANDTIFNFKKTPKHIILGDKIAKDDVIGVSTTSWETDHTSNRVIEGETKEITFDLLFIAQDAMDIAGWKKIVLKQMTGLLALSIIIFIIVIGLLYYSIKNYITQKKIADIKTDFVNNITHELKTPLATLTLATKMLNKDEVKQNTHFVESTVNTIERQNKRLQKLIDQVLNNSLGYEEIKLNREHVNIKDYINTILNDFELTQKSKEIIINRNFSIDTSHINIDKFYITTALLNILENAIKYSEETVVIDCNIESKNHLRIAIKDNGIGITDRDKKQIFEKFFRAGDKEIHNVKGLGLGLYYTNEIIKAHNGTITVDGNEGEGTSFILNIPFQ